MKIKSLFSLAAVALLACSSSALAADAKDYQVTGPILEMNDSMIAVKKGNDRWEVSRDANTKATGEMKVGDKVTIHYSMMATNIEVKAAKAEKAAKPAKK